VCPKVGTSDDYMIGRHYQNYSHAGARILRIHSLKCEKSLSHSLDAPSSCAKTLMSRSINPLARKPKVGFID
jgi:hypothetical protein